MKGEKLAVSIFIVGMCFILPLAVVLIATRLTKNLTQAIFRKLGLVPQVRESMPNFDFYPTGDIPQPEASNIGNELSVPR